MLYEVITWHHCPHRGDLGRLGPEMHFAHLDQRRLAFAGALLGLRTGRHQPGGQQDADEHHHGRQGITEPEVGTGRGFV